VIIDESSYYDAAQITLLTSFLDAADGMRKQVFMLGRDLQYGSSARPFMEKHTGTVYVKDDPNWRQVRSTPGDPIGAGETFVISGSYPDEVKRSTTYPGAQIIYKYSGVGSSLDLFSTEQGLREFYEKEGKEWDARMWPAVPSGPDTIAAARYAGTTFVSVYFAFNFNYIQEAERRAGILDRTLTWLSTAATGFEEQTTAQGASHEVPVPSELALSQNYPNPFNPVTQIQIGIPAGFANPVSVKIYDVRGQLVKTLFEGTKEPGTHVFSWDGRNDFGNCVSSGVYFCRFTAGPTTITRKMMILK